MKRKLHFNLFDVFVYSFCGLFAFICFYPLWYVFIGSISPYDRFSSAQIAFLPVGIPSLRYYVAIVKGPSFQLAFLVSVIKTVLGVAGMILITSCLAYGVSKSHVKGMKFINIYVIICMYFGGTIIQYYLLFSTLKLINTIWVMIIPGYVNVWTFIIMRNYFANNVPDSLEDAAMIDGANEVVLFARIIMPISKAMIAAMVLFSAVGHWNDWVSYTYYCNDIRLQPFVKILQRLLITPSLAVSGGTNEMMDEAVNIPPIALQYTTIMCAMLPIIAVYPFLQKHFAKGILIGAVKE